MKTAITFIMLLVITASVAVQGQDRLVKDVNGNRITAGNQYYLKPVHDFGPGVWLSFFRPNEETPCPQLAVLSGSPYISPREPVVIIPEDSSSRHESGYVYESTDLRFKFQRMDGFCPDQTGIWKILDRSSSRFHNPKIAGTGTLTSGDVFNIKKYNRGYLLNAFGRDVRIAESFPIGERGVYYLEYSTTGNLFEVNFVPVDDPWMMSTNHSIS